MQGSPSWYVAIQNVLAGTPVACLCPRQLMVSRILGDARAWRMQRVGGFGGLVSGGQELHPRRGDVKLCVRSKDSE